MKKNLIAVAVAGVLAVPFAAQAADINFSGDARYKYFSVKNDTTGTTVDTSGRNNRVRLKVDAKMDGGASAHARTTFDKGAAATSDYAYIGFKAGPVAVSAGDQMATWGHKIIADGTAKPNRIKLAMKTGGMKLMATDDNESVTVYALGKAGAGSFGVLYNNGAEKYDIFYKGKAGDISYGVETLNVGATTAGADDQNMMHVNFGMPMGGMGLKFQYVTTKGGYATDDDFEPLIGLNVRAGGKIGANGDSTLMALTVSTKAAGMNVALKAGTYEDTVATVKTSDSAVGVAATKGFGAVKSTFYYGTIGKVTKAGITATVKF